MSRTTGLLVAKPHGEDIEEWSVIKPDPSEPDWPWFVATCHGSPDEGSAQGNAEFIAEAFNVADETGLTPRQLAEQRVELLVALQWMLRYPSGPERHQVETHARAVFEKCKARGQS
jgi:hypothetical protein